jgi:hypothetical protein
MKSYDRSDGETSKAYAAFTIYRDMGVSRSLKATTEKYYSAECPPNVRRAKGMRHIEEWSSKYNWVARCKDYDLDRESELREHTRLKSIEEHDRLLEQFRQKNEKIGFGLSEMGLRLLAIGNRIVDTLENKEVLDSKDVELFLAFPSSIKAIGAIGASGSELAADGLCIRQMMERIEELKEW